MRRYGFYNINGTEYRLLVWEADGQYGMREGVIARICYKVLQWMHKSEWLYNQCVLDKMACRVPAYEVSPMWTLMWWCCLPSRIVKRLSINLDELWRREHLANKE